MTTDPSLLVVQRWSTADVQASKRTAYFAAACDRALIPLRLSIPQPARFEASIEAIELGPLLVMRHIGTPHACTSGRREISRQREHNFNIVLSRNASWRLDHRGPIVLHPGAAVLTDSQLEMHIEQVEPYECVNIRIPEPWLRQWTASPGALVGRGTLSVSRWGAVLSTYLGALTPEFVSTAPLPPTVLSDQLGALLALVSADLAGPLKGPRLDRQLAALIDDQIRQRCTDPSLTAGDVAASLGVSVRTLHRTLAAQDRTFGAALIAARLDIATRLLQSSLFDRVTTAQIGRRAGFSGPSHFVRSFKQRVGISPARFRRQT